MAGGAALAQRLLLEHERPALHLVALRAIFLLRKQLRAAAGVGDALVRRMALDASHPAFGHGMVARKIELAAHVRVALVTGGFNRARRFEREPAAQDFPLRPSGGETERRFDITARILVQAARAVAGFTAGDESVFAEGEEPRMVGSLEAAADFVVTLFTIRGADVFCARHIRERHGLMADGAAGNHNEQQEP